MCIPVHPWKGLDQDLVMIMVKIFTRLQSMNNKGPILNSEEHKILLACWGWSTVIIILAAILTAIFETGLKSCKSSPYTPRRLVNQYFMVDSIKGFSYVKKTTGLIYTTIINIYKEQPMIPINSYWFVLISRNFILPLINWLIDWLIDWKQQSELGTDHYFLPGGGGGGGYQKLLKKLFAQSKRVKKIVCLKFSGKNFFAKEINTTHILRKQHNRNFNFIIHLTWRIELNKD